MIFTDQLIIEDIKAGNDKALIWLYKQYRIEFIHWAIRNYNLSEPEAADVFQDSIIAMRRNIINDKLQFLTSSLKTYLFGIGKNLVKTSLKKYRKEFADDDMIKLRQNKELSGAELLIEDEQRVMVAHLISKLGEPCLSILKLYYYENFSMDSIASKLNYKNENVVKSQKLRCINKLKAQLVASN